MKEVDQSNPRFRLSSIRPEAELLLCYTRRTIDPATSRRIDELLSKGLDWGYLFDLSFRHRLTPYLHTRIREQNPDAFPSEFLARLHANAEAISRNNLLLTGELVKILKLFAAHDLPVFPFKGPPLAQQLHGNLAMRPFSDIDLMIPRAEVIRARDLLKGIGYEPRPILTPRLEEAHLRFEHDRAFEELRSGAHLELHWRFFSGYVAFPLDDDGEIWKRLRREKFMGIDTLAMPPEELLLFLAAHGAKHHWYLLGWILDIARMIETQEDLDWARARSFAHEMGVKRMLRLALLLPNILWGTPIPEPLRAETENDGAVARLASDVMCLIFERESESLRGMEEHRFYLASRERLRDRLHYSWFWLTTPNARDRAFIPLPSPLAPLYYLTRPLRMLRDIGGRLVGA
jgi:hypothetical protein